MLHQVESLDFHAGYSAPGCPGVSSQHSSTHARHTQTHTPAHAITGTVSGAACRNTQRARACVCVCVSVCACVRACVRACVHKHRTRGRALCTHARCLRKHARACAAGASMALGQIKLRARRRAVVSSHGCTHRRNAACGALHVASRMPWGTCVPERLRTSRCCRRSTGGVVFHCSRLERMSSLHAWKVLLGEFPTIVCRQRPCRRRTFAHDDYKFARARAAGAPAAPTWPRRSAARLRLLLCLFSACGGCGLWCVRGRASLCSLHGAHSQLECARARAGRAHRAEPASGCGCVLVAAVLCCLRSSRAGQRSRATAAAALGAGRCRSHRC
jgi:hypothetical protein